MMACEFCGKKTEDYEDGWFSTGLSAKHQGDLAHFCSKKCYNRIVAWKKVKGGVKPLFGRDGYLPATPK